MGGHVRLIVKRMVDRAEPLGTLASQYPGFPLIGLDRRR